MLCASSDFCEQDMLITTAHIAFLSLLTNEPSSFLASETQQPREILLRRPPSSSSTENYLPRRLYPGTYKNYCGPTPEITIQDGCRARGWHGDEALDQVDAACQLHDVSYCSCETQLLSRKYAAGKAKERTEGLSSIVALRFATRSTLYKTNTVDKEYLGCIHKADTELISTGIKIRGQQQRSNCGLDPSLSWFCQEGGTLAAFEKVNLNIFLKDLDADERSYFSQKFPSSITLSQLESKRQSDLMKEVKSGKTIADASSSQTVEEDEEQMLQLLRIVEVSETGDVDNR